MSSLDASSVLVVGLGASGLAAAGALVGRVPRVKVTEERDDDVFRERARRLRSAGAEVEIGGHDLDRIDADLAILSPGIPPTAPVVRALEGAGMRIWSEVELAFRLASCHFLAVTGTNGKTTTTSLLAEMLREAGFDTRAAGNIGTPLVEVAARMPAGGAVAVEVSSFQLATIERFRPDVAILLNIAEDHTDWHGSREAYAAAKARITENQTGDDVFIPNADDPLAMDIALRSAAEIRPFSAERMPDGGIGRRGDVVLWDEREVMRVDDVALPGVAGLEDAIAAAGAALSFGADPRAVRRAVMAFRPLRHRLQVVAEADGVTYVDDSKATNPHATLAAVRGLKDVVLIAGGRSKGMDLRRLAGAVPPVISVVSIGEAAPEVAAAFEGSVPVARAGSMDEAVRIARERSVPGGSVLLSPGCASLDMYTDYAERGDDFARAVRDIVGAGGGGSETHGD